MTHTLEVYRGEQLVYWSDSRWLHPLIELETFLRTSPYAPAGLTVHDRVTGRAAALLLVYMGIQTLHTEVLSEPGRDILERYGVTYTVAQPVIPRIACATERLLLESTDPVAAWELVQQRLRG